MGRTPSPSNISKSLRFFRFWGVVPAHWILDYWLAPATPTKQQLWREAKSWKLSHGVFELYDPRIKLVQNLCTSLIFSKKFKDLPPSFCISPLQKAPASMCIRSHPRYWRASASRSLGCWVFRDVLPWQVTKGRGKNSRTFHLCVWWHTGRCRFHCIIIPAQKIHGFSFQVLWKRLFFWNRELYRYHWKVWKKSSHT